MDDFGKSRAVHTIRWPAVRDAISGLQVQQFYGSLRDRTVIRAQIERVGKMLRDWLRPIINLDGLPHGYHTNGTHAAIEHWLATETRRVCCLRGEYQYPRLLCASVMVIDDIADIPSDAVVYLSNPFSATGCFDLRYGLIANPMVLDLAYVGTTAIREIPLLDNVEQVFWSASKAFGLSSFRTGFRYTRHPDMVQDNLKDVGYSHWLSIEVLAAAIQTYAVGETMALVYPDYEDICQRNNLHKSHSYLLALSDSPEHQHFARDDGHRRVPVGRILDDRHGWIVNNASGN